MTLNHLTLIDTQPSAQPSKLKVCFISIIILFISKMERNLEAAQENVGDHQQTIVKFRDLVAKLQVKVNFNYIVINKLLLSSVILLSLHVHIQN